MGARRRRADADHEAEAQADSREVRPGDRGDVRLRAERDARWRLLFVCLGNICRSPTAEAVMAHVLAEAGLEGVVEVDSAGTGSWHIGHPADPRSRAAAAARGIEITSTARQVRPADFDDFDLILAADQDNRRDLLALAGDDPARAAKVRLLREFDPHATELAVPDPYYGGPGGFEDVLDLVEAACRGLLAALQAGGQI